MLRKYVILVVPPIIALLLVAYQQVRVVNTGYRLEYLKGELGNILLEREILESEIAAMKSPEHLLSRAGELGMQFELPVVQAPRLALRESASGAGEWERHTP